MKGKIKPSTVFERLRSDVLERYNTELTDTHPFYVWFKEHDNISKRLNLVTDENGAFLWDKPSWENVIYRIVRMSNRNLYLRELEQFTEYFYSLITLTNAEFALKDHYRFWLYEKLAVLHSLHYIDIKFRSILESRYHPSNDVLISIDDD